jgi:hypothetical protein
VRSYGPDRFGQAEGDKTDDREILLIMSRERLTFLRTAEPIRTMEQEREIISKDSAVRSSAIKRIAFFSLHHMGIGLTNAGAMRIASIMTEFAAP